MCSSVDAKNSPFQRFVIEDTYLLTEFCKGPSVFTLLCVMLFLC